MKEWKRSGEFNQALAQMGRSGDWFEKVELEGEEESQWDVWMHIKTD